MRTDFNHLRASTTCPLCNNEKDAGSLTCWTCYHSHDLRNGLRPYAQTILENADYELATGTPARYRFGGPNYDHNSTPDGV